MIDYDEVDDLAARINEAPEQAQAIIDSSPKLGICITDEAGKFVLVNNNYCKYYGYDRDELTGQPFTMVVQRQDRAEMTDLHEKFINNQTEIVKVWEVVRKDGETMMILVEARYTDRLEGKPHKITFVLPATEVI